MQLVEMFRAHTRARKRDGSKLSSASPTRARTPSTRTRPELDKIASLFTGDTTSLALSSMTGSHYQPAPLDPSSKFISPTRSELEQKLDLSFVARQMSHAAGIPDLQAAFVVLPPLDPARVFTEVDVLAVGKPVVTWVIEFIPLQYDTSPNIRGWHHHQ